MAIGRGRYGGERNTGRLDGERAIEALLASIHGAAAGHLTTAGCGGEVTVDA